MSAIPETIPLRSRPRREARVRRPAVRPRRSRFHAPLARAVRVPSVAARLDRGLAYYVAGAAVLALLVLYLLQAAQVTAAGYRIERLQAQQQDLLAEQAQLRYEEASLQAPARVQAEASRTGLQRIAPAGYVPYRSVALDVSGGATSEPAQAAPFWARLLAEIGFRAA